MPISIAGRACRLRQWFGSDAEALVPLANDPYIARYHDELIYACMRPN